MMTLAEIIVAIVLALGIGLFFYFVFKVSGPWGSFWAFLGILILAGLAAEAWIGPVGPTIWGAPWLTAFFVILLFALLIAAATPPRTVRGEASAAEYATEMEEANRPAAVAFGIFFWVFLLVMLGIAIWGFFYTPVVY